MRRRDFIAGLGGAAGAAAIDGVVGEIAGRSARGCSPARHAGQENESQGRPPTCRAFQMATIFSASAIALRSAAPGIAFLANETNGELVL